MGRPRMTDEEREAKRLAKNARQRERRAHVKRAKEDARRKLAREGVLKSEPAVGGAATGFEPTLEDRARVQSLAGLGMRHDEIAIMVVNPATNAPVDEKTLRRHFEPELREGPVKANSKVAESLYQQATGTGGVARSTTAGIFWAKSRMGWRETQHVEVDVKSGVLIAPAGMSPEDWVRAAHEANADKTEPGKKSEGEG